MVNKVVAASLALILLFGSCDGRSSATSLLRRLAGKNDASKKTESNPRRRLDSHLQEVTIDFNTAADGSQLPGGKYVEIEWAAYGLTLSAAGGYGTIPRLFNSAQPRDENNRGGDPDLGSPNRKCSPAGPGVGSGGEPGQDTANCEPLGNVLIIQEENDDLDIPDDNRDGGTIAFDFSEDTMYVKEIGFLDTDKPNSTIVVVYEEDSILKEKVIDIPRVGNNGVQTVTIDIANVRQLLVNLKDSGAVTFITYETSVKPDCITTTVDFLTAADGSTLEGGLYVENQWAEYGLSLSATGGLGDVPRVFNTSDVGDGESGFGDRDLGSPNEMCDIPGPGEGIGGQPGAPGENCNLRAMSSSSKRITVRTPISPTTTGKVV